MNDIDKTLGERGENYGDFRTQAMVAQRLKQTAFDALADNPKFMSMPVSDQMVVREGLAMVLHKISRVVNGDPAYDDSWLDIEGYSKITRERVCKPRKGT